MKDEFLLPPKGNALASTRTILFPPLSSEGTWFFKVSVLWALQLTVENSLGLGKVGS